VVFGGFTSPVSAYQALDGGTNSIAGQGRGAAALTTFIILSSGQPAQHPVRVLRSFHLDFHAHPGMDAALKEMLALRKACELKLAALQDSGSGNLNSRKA